MHDITQTKHMLQGEEKCVWGDVGYVGVEKCEAYKDRHVDWLIAMRPGKRVQLAKRSDRAQTEKTKVNIQAKVEHVFSVIKQHFGYNEVRYRGLAKNTNRLYVLAGFANLLRAEKYLPT